MVEQAGLNLSWSKIPEDTFSRDVAHNENNGTKLEIQDSLFTNAYRYSKTYNITSLPAKSPISLCIRTVRSASSLGTLWRIVDEAKLHYAGNED